MLSFLARLLLIRLKQAGRAIWEVGWLLVVAVPMGCILLFVLWDKLAGLQAWELAGLLTLFMFALHWQRKDLAFLQKCGQAVPLILLVEYQLAALFITLPVACLSPSWEGALYSHLAIVSVAFIPVPQRSGNRKVMTLSWLPKHNLEWKSGIRRQWRILLPVYVAGILLSAYIPGTLLSIAFCLMVALGFYDELENRMLLESALQPNFLWSKWGKHYGLFVLLMLPHLILYMFFHARYWYFLVFILAVAGVFLGCAIFYKYSTYLPNRRRANNQTPMSIMFMSLIIPFLSPLSLIAFFVLHHKANKRLQYFFPNA